MLVVKIEIWPHGDPIKAKELGRLYIANIGGNLDKGQYIVSENLQEIDNRQAPIEIPSHTRSRGFWPLVKQAITKLVSLRGL